MQPTDNFAPSPNPAAIAAARAKLQAPAVCIIAAEALGLVLTLGTLLFKGAILAFAQKSMEASGQKLPPGSMDTNPIVTVIGILGGLFVVFAMLEMRKARRFPLAVAGAILAMLPFGSLCCIFGFPFGIWALVVLFNAEVRAAFT